MGFLSRRKQKVLTEFKLYPVGELPLEYVDKKRRKEWQDFLHGIEEEPYEPETPPEVPQDARDRIAKLKERFQEQRAGRMAQQPQIKDPHSLRFHLSSPEELA